MEGKRQHWWYISTDAFNLGQCTCASTRHQFTEDLLFPAELLSALYSVLNDRDYLTRLSCWLFSSHTCIFCSVTLWVLLYLDVLVHVSEFYGLLPCPLRNCLLPIISRPILIFLRKIRHLLVPMEVMFLYFKHWKIFPNQHMCTYYKENKNVQYCRWKLEKLGRASTQTSTWSCSLLWHFALGCKWTF